MRERFCIGIAECAIDCRGSWFLFKPLQQRFRLRMVCCAGNMNREAWIRKHFNRIAGFKIVLAGAGFAGELPRWDLIIDERIVERLRNFMAERGHVLESGKNAGRNPTGKSKYPARFFWDSGVSKERMESQGAAAPHAAFIVERKDESIGEERDIQRVCVEASSVDLICHDIENLLVEKLVENKDRGMAVAGFLGEISLHLRAEAIHIHLDEARHSDGNAVDDGGRMQIRMPARLHLVEEFGALHGIGKLDAGPAGIIGELKVRRIERGR